MILLSLFMVMIVSLSLSSWLTKWVPWLQACILIAAPFAALVPRCLLIDDCEVRVARRPHQQSWR